MDLPLLTCLGETHAGEGGEKLARFKLWFWAIVEKMSNQQRQDLVSLQTFSNLSCPVGST